MKEFTIKPPHSYEKFPIDHLGYFICNMFVIFVHKGQ